MILKSRPLTLSHLIVQTPHVFYDKNIHKGDPYMIQRREVLIGLTGLCAMASLPACSVDTMTSAMDTAKTLSAGEAEEINMGKQLYPGYIAKSGGAYPNRNAQEALKRFAKPLIATADRKSLPWDITLINSKEVNAWAMPGGKLAINSELVRYCATPDELASVIAHEIGHADLGHSMQAMRTGSLLSTVGGLGKSALGTFGGSGGQLAASALSSVEGPLYDLILKGYSRSNEHEADANILKAFQKTSFDPAQSSAFFKTLMRLYPQSSSEATTSLFSTHPGTQERIDRLEEASARLPTKTAMRKAASVPGWAELKRALPTLSV